MAILEVRSDPVLSFAATDAGGKAVSARLLAGECRVGPVPGEGIMTTLAGAFSTPSLRLGFFVPGGGPMRPSHSLQMWAEMSLALTEIGGGDYGHAGPYGVDGVSAQLVEDDKGFGEQWPYLWFTAWGNQPMRLRWRLTLTEPAD